jgi:hypothetical protein
MATNALPISKRNWFCPTPGWLVLGLLIVELLLFLIERFCLVPKGWPVLIAIVGIAVVVLLTSLWFAVALIFRRRFQYSLRLLAAFVVVVALPFSWLAVQMRNANSQRRTVGEIGRLGGVVENDLLYFSGMQSHHREPLEPLWIRQVLGDDFFREISVSVEDDGELAEVSEVAGIERISALHLGATKITDTGLVSLRKWAALKVLNLPGTAITDTGLENLKELHELRFLYLKGTRVTDEGIKNLQKALPNCEIAY